MNIQTIQFLERDRLEALYSVSQAIGTSLDLDEVLMRVMDAVISLTGSERGFLILVDTGEKEGAVGPDWPLQLRAARNFERETLDQKDMEISQTVIRTVLESGNGLVTTNAQLDPRFANQDSVVFFNLRAILCAPLRVRGKILGVIYVDNKVQTGLFLKEDLELLETFAAQAAVAIENARLYMRTDQALAFRVAELETLSKIDQELNTHLDLQRVIEITREWAIRGTQAQEAWVALFSGDILRIMTNPGAGGEIDMDDPLISAALAGDENQQIAGSSESRPARLSVPLIRAGTRLGILILERKDNFSKDDLLFLKRLADRASIAIENASLFQAVQDANQAKSKFVSVVSHELRIPMTSIKGYTDLLRQGTVGPVNEMQSNFLNIIRSNVDRMTALVSDLSDISRIETGRLKLNLDWVSVPACIDEILLTLSPRIEEKGQTIDLAISTGLPLVYADSNRVVQILNNLVSNASKYTPQGGHIAIRASEERNYVRLEVVDNGIGISVEDQARLFQQFFRSENDAVREQQGWGLGLNIAKRMVEHMGGEIGLSSELDQGSTFWITLPTRQGGQND